MEEITVEKIKERIKENLKTVKICNSNFSPIESSERFALEQAGVIDSVNQKRKLKDKFISFGLKHKTLIKKIPLFNGIARKIYCSMMNIFVSESNALFSEKFRRFIKRIPFFGYLLWWAYMLLKAPTKIVMVYAGVGALEERLNELSPKVNGLVNGNVAFQTKVIELASEVNGLRGKDGALEERLNELSPKVNGLKNRDESDKRLGTDWAEFYSKEITKEDMEGNINHHRYFIDLIVEWANRCSDHHIPKLFEVGLGTATMSIYLSKRSFEVVGLDLDPLIVAKAIEANNKLGGHAKFIAMDAFDLPKFFKENAFDIAFSQGTMEHFDNDELKKILEAQLAVAMHVIFSVPSVNWPQEDFGNERKMTVEEWEKLLKHFGLKIEHISYYQEGDLHIAAVITSGDK